MFGHPASKAADPKRRAVPDPTPGPGQYNLDSSLLHRDPNKKFGFLEKSQRFRAAKADDAMVLEDFPDDDSETSNPRADSASHASKSRRDDREELRWKKEAENWKEKLERSAADHQRVVSQFQERLNVINAQLSTCQKEKNGLQSQAVSREKEVAELNQRIALMKANCEKLERTIATMNERASKAVSLQKKLEESEKNVQRVKSTAEKKTLSYEKLSKERDELAAQQSQFYQEIQALSDHKDKLTAQITQLEQVKQQTLQEFHTHLSNLEAQLNQAAVEKAALEVAYLAEKQALSGKLEETFGILQATTSALDESKAHCSQRELANQATQSRLENQISDLGRQLESLGREAAEKYTRYEASITQLREQCQTCQSLIAERETQLQQANEGIASLQNQLNTATTNLASSRQDLEAQSAEWNQAMTSFTAQMASLQSSIQERDSIIRERDALIAGFRSSLDELTSSLQQEQSKSQQLEDQLHETTQAKGFAIDALKLNLDEALAQIETQKAAFQAEKSLMEQKLEQLFVSLQQTQSEAQQSLHAHQTVVTNLNSQIDSLQSRLSELESARSTLESDKSWLQKHTEELLRASAEEMGSKDGLIAQYQLQLKEMDGCLKSEQDQHRQTKDAHASEASTLKSHLEQVRVELQAALASYQEADQKNAQLQSRIEDLDRVLQAERLKHSQELAQWDRRLKDHAAASEQERIQWSTQVEEIAAGMKALESTLHETRSALAQKGLECDTLSAQLHDRLQHSRGLEDSLVHHQSQLKQYESTMGSLQAALSETRQELDSARTELGRSEARVVSLETEGELSRSRIHELSQTSTRMASDLTLLQRQLDESVRHRTETQALLDDTREHLRTALENESNAHKQIERLQLRESDLINKIQLQETAAHESSLSHQQAIGNLQKELALLTQQASNLRESVQQQTLVIDEQRNMLSSERQSRDSLHQELQATKAQHERAIAELRSALQEREAQGLRDQKHIDSLAKAHRAEESRAAESERRIKGLSEELEAAKAAFSLERQRLADENRHQSLQFDKERQDLRQSADKMKSIVQTRALELEALSKEHEQLGRVNRELESSKSQLESEVLRLRHDNERGYALMAESEKARIRYQSQISAMESSHKADRQTWDAERAAHLRAVDELKAQTETLRTTHQSQIAEARTELSQASTQLAQMQLQLQATQEGHQAKLSAKDSFIVELRQSHDATLKRLEEAQGQNQQLDRALTEFTQEAEKNIARMKHEYDERETHLRAYSTQLEQEKAAALSDYARATQESMKREQVLRSMRDQMKEVNTYRQERDEAVQKCAESEKRCQVLDFQKREAIRLCEVEKNTCESKMKAVSAENQALKDRVSSMQMQIEEARVVRDSAEKILSEEARKLIRQQNMSKAELEALIAMQSDLVGHNNPKQKIRVFTQIKQENQQLKEENEMLQQEHKEMRRKNMELEREVEALKGSGDAGAHGKRSRVGRYATMMASRQTTNNENSLAPLAGDIANLGLKDRSDDIQSFASKETAGKNGISFNIPF